MEDKYIILVNKGVYNSYVVDGMGGVVGRGGNVFSREELDLIFNDWSGGEVMESVDGDEVYDVDKLIELGEMGMHAEIWNENMVEMGDDWVDVSIIKLDM
jgi:hypothetical protein